jgi:hypothetical protein
MRDRGIKDEPLCDQLKPFVTRNGWINHPLIVEMPPWSAAQINRRFAKKAKLAEELWGKQEHRRYLHLHERVFRLGALEKVLASSQQLPDAQIAKLVGEVWIDSENIHQDRGRWRRIWRSLKTPQSAMNDDDLAALAAQPDPLTVFRGVPHPRHDKLSLSWTTDRDRAISLARRFPTETDYLLLTSGQVAKKNIFAYFTSGKESEVVVLPRFIKNRKEEQI